MTASHHQRHPGLQRRRADDLRQQRRRARHRELLLRRAHPGPGPLRRLSDRDHLRPGRPGRPALGPVLHPRRCRRRLRHPRPARHPPRLHPKRQLLRFRHRQPRLRHQHHQHLRLRSRHLHLRPLRQHHHQNRQPTPAATSSATPASSPTPAPAPPPLYIHDGNRWYSPNTGNFTTQDTSNYLDDPANGNRYAYASDNPANYTDPTGQFSWASAIGGYVFGTLVTVTCSAALIGFTGGIGVLGEYGCGAAGVVAGDWFANEVTSS